ncbi:MAG: hypothetical protein EOO75_20080, partial [Myxococcales bacterium]
VVTLDGARWQELFLGVDRNLAQHDGVPSDEVVAASVLLPNIYERLIRRGVALGAPGHGSPVEASGPVHVSLPGYRELFVGAPDASCRSNDCGAVTVPTMADAIRERSARDQDVAVLSSWETIERAATVGTGHIVVSTGRTTGLTRDLARVSPRASQILDQGARADAWPGHDDYRPDRFTMPLALDYQLSAQPRFLFVGLGDTDEYAHRGDYRGYLGALRQADRFIGDLFASLDRQGPDGAATTVLVTADHGRARNFRDHGRDAESRRVFLLAAGGTVPAQGYVDAGPGRRLASIAPTVRGLLGLPATEGAIDEPWVAVGLGAPWASPSGRVASRGAGR